MAALDREKVIRFRAEVEDARQVLSEMTSGEANEFLRDPLKIRAMKYTLIVMVEAICNLCRHVLAKRAHTVVEEYMEAILKMQEKGFLPEELTNQLVPLTKLRNQLIHGYWKTDDRRLFSETKNSLEIITRFMEETRHLLQRIKILRFYCRDQMWVRDINYKFLLRFQLQFLLSHNTALAHNRLNHRSQTQRRFTLRPRLSPYSKDLLYHRPFGGNGGQYYPPHFRGHPIPQPGPHAVVRSSSLIQNSY
jgi:uncharacterized protein YutE (UPF0331/DUF86 family)